MGNVVKMPQGPGPGGMGPGWENFLGGNPDFSDCPFEKPPTDAKDYGIYRNYYERKMYEMLGGEGRISITGYCEFKDAKLRPIRSREKRPEHRYCGAAWACDHVIHQDPWNPEGFVFTPFTKGLDVGYYLCKTCRKIQEARKFDMDRVFIKCALCVKESTDRIFELKPDRCIDMRFVH